MHSFARHGHGKSDRESSGLILNGGWRYDLQQRFLDKFLFRGKMRELRQRTMHMAALQPGDIVLDVGCGTGSLAIEAQQYVGEAGQVVGIDPGTQQIARARSKAARRHLPVDFQIGVIEHLPFPDASFDVVLSTIMMHHLSDRLCVTITVGNDQFDEGEYISSEPNNYFSFEAAVIEGYKNMGKSVSGFSGPMSGNEGATGGD